MFFFCTIKLFRLLKCKRFGTKFFTSFLWRKSLKSFQTFPFQRRVLLLEGTAVERSEYGTEWLGSISGTNAEGRKKVVQSVARWPRVSWSTPPDFLLHRFLESIIASWCGPAPSPNDVGTVLKLNYFLTIKCTTLILTISDTPTSNVVFSRTGENASNNLICIRANPTLNFTV